MRYHWPGNVRELENSVKRAMVITKGNTLLPEDFLLDGVELKRGLPSTWIWMSEYKS